MRLVTRNDTSLAVGLIVGTIVVFQQPLNFALRIARDVESRYHLDLVPALTIIVGVFLFHQYRKRQLSKAEALIASADAARARARSEELERLMTFSQALANALDVQTLQQVLSRNLPAFAHDRVFWVLARADGRWQEILQDTTREPRRSLDVLEPLADRAIASPNLPDGHVEGSAGTETICFAMHAGGAPTGVLGVSNASATLRREIATLAIAGAGARVLPVNVSVGLAVAGPAELDVAGFIKRTDEALYRAKRAGRDRVCLAVTPTAGSPESYSDALIDGAGGHPGGATETILVAEDEPLTRELIRRWLEPLGYTVLVAGNGADALRIAAAHDGPIHLLLSDIVMPDLDGRELARRIGHVKPEIRTLFVSGFVALAGAADSATAGREAGFLAKPFSSADLVAKIRAQLDAAPGLIALP